MRLIDPGSLGRLLHHERPYVTGGQLLEYNATLVFAGVLEQERADQAHVQVSRRRGEPPLDPEIFL